MISEESFKKYVISLMGTVGKPKEAVNVTSAK
jgi:hypothetical protein